MDAEALKVLYKSLDLPIILAVCIVTQQIKHLFADRWRPLIPLVLGAMAAFAVQDLSPYATTFWSVWRRTLTYGAGAVVVFSLRKAWMPRGIVSGDDA